MRQSILLFLVALVLGACDTPSQRSAVHDAPSASGSITGYSRFIPLDSGNKMLGSYLTSIDAPDNNNNLKSLIIVADSLRVYLQNNSITHVKIMLSHSLDYINSGHGGQPAGYDAEALTCIIAAYDAQGNYVFRNNMVLERSMPCPANCVTVGTAAGDLLTE